MTNRIGIIEAFKRMHAHNETLHSIIFYVCGILAGGWFLESFFSFLNAVFAAIFGKLGWRVLTEDFGLQFQNAVLDLFVPSLFLLLVFLWAFRSYKKSLPQFPIYLARTTHKHRGLILMLSTFWHHRDHTNNVSGLMDMIEEGVDKQSLRTYAFHSNWGPLIVALERHKPKLEHCWVICTKDTGDPDPKKIKKGSVHQFENFEQVVYHFAGEHVQCHKGFVKGGVDASHVQSTAHVVHLIYKNASTYGLKDEDIVADFTGGTSAMTAGMILATLDEKRHIEYLSQLKALIGDNLEARTVAELETAEVLEEVVTSYEDVKVEIPSLVSESEVDT